MPNTKVLSRKTVFTSTSFKVVQKVIERNNNTFTKDTIERRSMLLVIPYTNDEMYIESQYRDSLETRTVEIVQGTLEDDEDILDAAKRELREEAGLTAKKWKKLAEWDVVTTMKFRAHVFAATDLEVGEQQLEFDEDITIMKLSINEVLQKIESGELSCAAHVAAILLFDRLRKEGKL